MAEATNGGIIVKLAKVAALDNKGKEIKDKDGDIQYKQEDIQGLYALINRYDNTKHPGAMKIFKALIAVRDKLETTLIKEKDQLQLTLDEGSWLKSYLTELADKEAKDRPLAQFEIRTLVSILDQLN